MTITTSRLLAGVIVLLISGHCPQALSQSRSGTLGDWTVNVGPSLWGAGISGDIGVGTMDAELDVRFKDIIENLNIALSGRIDVSNGPWRLYADGLFVEIEADEAVSPGTVGPFSTPMGQVGPFSPTARFDFTQDVTVVEAGVAYNLGTWPLSYSSASSSGAKTLSVDVLAGARYTDYSTEVDFKNGTKVTMDEDWIDPYVGTDLRYALGGNWGMTLHLDVGGFGVGSDFTYNTVGGLSYQFGDTRRAFFGYRVLYQDYEDGTGANRYKWDATTHGPVVGMEFRF